MATKSKKKKTATSNKKVSWSGHNIVLTKELVFMMMLLVGLVLLIQLVQTPQIFFIQAKGF